jgi:predicted Zn-dependent protease
MTLIASLLWLTHQRATVWGNSVLMSALTASHETDSTRAQVAEAQAELERGDTTAAIARVQQLVAIHPDSIDVGISAIGLECQAVGALSPSTLTTTQRALAHSRRWHYGLYIWLREAANHPKLRACHGFGTEGLLSLVNQAEHNPQNQTPVRQRDLGHVRGHIALANGDTLGALHWFNSALKLVPDATYTLVQAAALGNAGAPALALQHMDIYTHLERDSSSEQVRDMPALHRWLLKHYGYHDKELLDLRRRLRADAATAVP